MIANGLLTNVFSIANDINSLGRDFRFSARMQTLIPLCLASFKAFTNFVIKRLVLGLSGISILISLLPL